MIAVLLAVAFAWDPSPAESTLVKALSGRDGAPPCAELEALVPDPVESLANIVAHVEMPPWAPMTAASCLIERHAAERPDLIAEWVDGPQTKGLAKLVFRRLHLLEADQQERLVTKARSGPWAAELEVALVRSPDAGLRSRAEPAVK